jgi:hypothetical protein
MSAINRFATSLWKDDTSTPFQRSLFKIGCGFGVFCLIGFIGNIVNPPPPPTPLTAEQQAKIDDYLAEERNYYKVQTKCGPDASGFLCDMNLNDLAKLEVKHARWTIARRQKFGKDYDVEAQWIVARAPKLY